MKNVIKMLGIGVLSLTLLTGCQTTPQNQHTLDQAAILLEGTATAGATYAIQKDVNAKAYFKLIVVAIDIFVTQSDLSPEALDEALTNVSVNELKKPEIRMAITSAITVYKLFWSEKLDGWFSTDANGARLLLAAISNGFRAATQ